MIGVHSGHFWLVLTKYGLQVEGWQQAELSLANIPLLVNNSNDLKPPESGEWVLNPTISNKHRAEKQMNWMPVAFQSSHFPDGRKSYEYAPSSYENCPFSGWKRREIKSSLRTAWIIYIYMSFLATWRYLIVICYLLQLGLFSLVQNWPP